MILILVSFFNKRCVAEGPWCGRAADALSEFEEDPLNVGRVLRGEETSKKAIPLRSASARPPHPEIDGLASDRDGAGLEGFADQHEVVPMGPMRVRVADLPTKIKSKLWSSPPMTSDQTYT